MVLRLMIAVLTTAMPGGCLRAQQPGAARHPDGRHTLEPGVPAKLARARHAKFNELYYLEGIAVRKAEIAQFGQASGGPDNYAGSGRALKRHLYLDVVAYPSPGQEANSDTYRNRLVILFRQTPASFKLLSWHRIAARRARNARTDYQRLQGILPDH
ncbi:MAG TPA: hypothetical protein VGS41_15455, partial [Chthonomonadales bacterium]|nr:hypothetical protein [Chthonomonadales bacterium]